MKLNRAIFLGFFLCAVPVICRAGTPHFHDIHKQSLQSGTGTLSFRFKLLKDTASDPHNHVLLLGVSSDSAEDFKIQIIQDQLIVHRRFARCVLASFVAPCRFPIGEWHALKLAWHGESTRFYLDEREVKPLGLFSSQDIFKMVPEIRLGSDNYFAIDQFQVSGESDIPVSPKDREFVKNVVCTDLNQLLRERRQEEYRGIELRNFPDQPARDKIKTYIDLLPPDFAKAIKNIVFVEDKRFLKGGEGGFADSETGSLVLRGSVYDDPTVFFHEAAHLYDQKLRINFGVPDEKSEWAAISGASCYFKGAKMDEYYENFRKTSVGNAFLSPQGGQCASEDLAIWVGTVYDIYLKGKTLADRLNPSSPNYSKKNIQKMDFILKKGFISRKIYDKVTR